MVRDFPDHPVLHRWFTTSFRPAATPGFSTVQDYLWHTATCGLRRVYHLDDPAAPRDARERAIVDRLAFEFGVVTAKGLTHAFLVATDMIRWGRLNGVVVGPGRGAISGSLLAHVLGLTQVDPICLNLTFEGFVNPEGIRAPRWQFEFGVGGRQRIIRYLRRKYGSDRVTFMAGAAPSGVHAAAVAISDVPMRELVPLACAKGRIAVAEATRDELTSRGVLILDLLEFCVLDDIQRQVSVAQRRAGEGVDLAQLPLDDGDTFELLQRGDTSGIFQLASDEQRQVLIAFAPGTFADLVALLALTHEKTKETMASLLRRRQGSEPIAYAHPMLEPVLRETVGLFIYAEQVQQAITILSGHTPGQAAILTRILEWKTDDGRCADARRRIICGCIAGGIPGKYAAALVDELEAAAGRTVRKASVASYALLSYWLAYLKAHDPEGRQTGGNT